MGRAGSACCELLRSKQAATSGIARGAFASPDSVAQIVQTVQNIAIAALYPGPIFSFSA